MIPISFSSPSHRAMQNGWKDRLHRRGYESATFDETSIQRVPENKDALGYGYFFWKPIIIHKALDSYEEIVYTDVDYNILDLDKLKEILDSSSKGVVLFHYPFVNKIWTKRDCFHFMDCDEEKYWNTLHLEAGISLWRRSQYAYNILNIWEAFCSDRRIISSDQNICGLPNFPEFREPRYDQSILTNLKERMEIETHPLHILNGVISGADI
jgi:hypothetical protein